MVVPRLIFVLVCSLLSMQTQGDEPKLPDWISAPDEANVFVVETIEFSNHLDVANGLLVAVKAGVTDWAQRNFGADCDQVIESIPIEDFSELIEKEHVHESPRVYDEASGKFDIYCRGYARVNVNETFRNLVQQRLKKIRLKNRLGVTLVVALFVVGLVAIGWAYMFANRISRGFYISRIRWIAGGLFIALILICYSVSQMLF